MRLAPNNMKLFRTATTLLIVALLVGAPLHGVLLASDNPTYRKLVYLQMLLYLLGAWLLWLARKFHLPALVAFAPVSSLGIYINAVHLNYGNGAISWLAPFLFLVLYAALAFLAREGFISKGHANA
jgi:hypothetical protein